MSALHPPEHVGVSDEVWATLDPYAGRMSRRAVWGYLWVVATLLVGIIALVTLIHLDVLTIRVTGQATQATAIRDSHVITLDVTLSNDDARSAHVVAIIGGSGVTATALGALPIDVAGHSTAPIRIRMTVTNCRAARHGATAVYARVSRFWGDQSQTILARSDIGSLLHTACTARS